MSKKTEKKKRGREMGLEQQSEVPSGAYRLKAVGGKRQRIPPNPCKKSRGGMKEKRSMKRRKRGTG